MRTRTDSIIAMESHQVQIAVFGQRRLAGGCLGYGTVSGKALKIVSVSLCNRFHISTPENSFVYEVQLFFVFCVSFYWTIEAVTKVEYLQVRAD